MKQFDIVKLTQAFEGMDKGTVGTVLEKYSEFDYEVEFFDKNMRTIKVCEVKKELLEIADV